MTVRIARWPARALLLLAMLLAMVTVQATTAHATYALLEGDGSTWSQGIVNQWIADAKPMGMQVVYSGIGSSGGRKSFANYQDDFAISEIPYQGTDPQDGSQDTSSRPYAYLPIVAGGTSFTYHVVQAGKLMRDVRLSGDTIAKIFTAKITNWNDPAIKADNNGRTFPDLAIKPVYRSDGSGTTAQLTAWLDKQYSAIWRTVRPGGGLTSNFPPSGPKMIGANGSDQVMNTISADSGNGTIGYVEYSYALNKDYPVVKVLNAAGYYVEPTAYNVAVALTKARIDMSDPSSLNYLTEILDDVYTNADARTYPLSSYSYMILPIGSGDRRMTTAKRQTLVDFMSYGLCTGQAQAGPYGYSPLPLNLVQAGMTQLAKIKAADSAVSIDNVDPTKCGNPTFVAGDLTRNHLAEIAPQPAACDKQNAGPCLGTGQSAAGVAGSGTSSQTAAGTSGTGKSTTPGSAAGGTGAAAGSSTQIDPETGLAGGDTNADGTGAGPSGAVATTIAARPASGSAVFTGLSAAELVALAVVPGMLVVRRRRGEQGEDQP